MEHLVRTAVGSFRIEDALRLSEIEARMRDGTIGDVILPTETFYRDLDSVIVARAFQKQLQNGNPLKPEQLCAQGPQEITDESDEEMPYTDGMRVRVYDEDGIFYGISRFDERKQLFYVEKWLL